MIFINRILYIVKYKSLKNKIRIKKNFTALCTFYKNKHKIIHLKRNK